MHPGRQPDEQEGAPKLRHANSGTTIRTDCHRAVSATWSCWQAPSVQLPCATPRQLRQRPGCPQEDEGGGLPHSCIIALYYRTPSYRTAARRAVHHKLVQGRSREAEKLTHTAACPQMHCNRVESAQKPPSEPRASSSRSTTLGAWLAKICRFQKQHGIWLTLSVMM